MQQYGDNWGQQSMPFSPSSSSQYHSSPPSTSSSNNSHRKKDKDKDRSDKSSRRDKANNDSSSGGKHNKRNSSSAGQHSQSNNNSSSNNSSTFSTPPSSMYSTPPSPTTPPSPPSPPLPPLRVDLHARHQALNTLLTTSGGESRVASYWGVIELFLRAQLSKAELDGEVKRLVGDEHLATHNDFFFALLQNAMSDELPSAAKTKREGESGGGSAGKVDKAEKVKREGVEVTGKEGQKIEGKDGKRDKEKGKEGKRDKSGVPSPLTPTAAAAASLSATAVKSEDNKKDAKKRKDGALKGEKEGKRDKRRERHEEEEAMDWTEQAWPLPPPPQRWSDVSQASVHREMKHIVSASDYFATLRRERERRGVGREGDGEEGGKAGGDWLWAIEESKVGYLRVRSAEEEVDDSRASVNHAVNLIRRRARSKRKEAEERKEDDGSQDDSTDGVEDESNGRPPAWLNPGSSAAYRTSPLSLPALPVLRARCLLTAKHGGLKSISESALSLIHQAMCQYVRMLLAEMVADRTQPVVQNATPTTTQQQEEADGGSGPSAMDVDRATESTSSHVASTDSSSSPSTFTSSFPSSCFAPSLFTPLPSSSPSDAPVKAEADEPPAAPSTPLVRDVSSVDTSSASPPPARADASTAGAQSDVSTGSVKMETDAAVGSPPEVESRTSKSVSEISATALSIAPPPTSVRSLSVSVPTSPPSLDAPASTPLNPSTQLAERARKAEEAMAKEALDDARTTFPFLIARQPAYRPAPPAPPFLAQQLSSAVGAMGGALRGGCEEVGASSGGVLSLADLLDCLRDRRGSTATMRVADDLTLLLERLIIVQ